MKKEEFVIVLRNTYVSEPLLDKNGNFVTNKSDQDNHGFGISSVKKAVEKYEGEILFQVKDGLFEAIVIINSKSSISG